MAACVRLPRHNSGMTGLLMIRAFCPECCDEHDVQMARVLGSLPDEVEAPSCCCDCGSELVLRAYDGGAGPHGLPAHELHGFTAAKFAPYWSFVCSCGWRSHQPCDTREDAAGAWARHAAAHYVRARSRVLTGDTVAV